MGYKIKPNIENHMSDVITHIKTKHTQESLYSTQDFEDNLELSSLIYTSQWSHVSTRIKSCPDQTNIYSGNFLPLIHAILNTDTPIEIIQLLLKANPDSIHIGDKKYNLLPLQWAIQSNHNLSLIKLLVEGYNNALLIKDKYGKTPLLYYLCYEKLPSLEIVKLLVESRNSAASIKDNYQCLPLHYAVRSKNWDIIIYLIELYSNGLIEEDIAGLVARDY